MLLNTLGQPLATKSGLYPDVVGTTLTELTLLDAADSSRKAS